MANQAREPSTENTETENYKFLIACIKFSTNGKIDFGKVASDLGIVSKAAAAKRYERLMKRHGIKPPNGVAARREAKAAKLAASGKTTGTISAHSAHLRSLASKKRRLNKVDENAGDVDEPDSHVKNEVKCEHDGSYLNSDGVRIKMEHPPPYQHPDGQCQSDSVSPVSEVPVKRSGSAVEAMECVPNASVALAYAAVDEDDEDDDDDVLIVGERQKLSSETQPQQGHQTLLSPRPSTASKSSAGTVMPTSNQCREHAPPLRYSPSQQMLSPPLDFSASHLFNPQRPMTSRASSSSVIKTEHPMHLPHHPSHHQSLSYGFPVARESGIGNGGARSWGVPQQHHLLGHGSGYNGMGSPNASTMFDWQRSGSNC